MLQEALIVNAKDRKRQVWERKSLPAYLYRSILVPDAKTIIRSLLNTVIIHVIIISSASFYLIGDTRLNFSTILMGKGVVLNVGKY